MSAQVSKYIKEYVVKSYEADCHGFLRILTLMNVLQDIACENADVLGFGFDKCHESGVAWVGANYLIKINRLPQINEHFKIETWPAVGKLWGAIRDFCMKDMQGNVLLTASSLWVLIDYARRRPVALSKHFPEYSFLNERAVDEDFHKIQLTKTPDTTTEFAVRFDDIDVNNHVNNSVYPVWASESVAQEFRVTHLPQEMEMCFKKEALYGERVEVLTEMNGTESIHVIKDKSSGDELAECRFVWRKRE